MRHLPVAFPAFPLTSLTVIMIGIPHQFFIRYEFGMTVNTVGLHHFPAFLFYKDHLGFSPQGKYGGMTQTVLCLEIIFIKNIIMRNMAVIAMGMLSVGTVAPGGILRRHDMAVHTGFGFVRKIGWSIADMEHISGQSKEYGHQKEYRDLPFIGRN